MPADSTTARTAPPAMMPVPSGAGFRSTWPAPNRPNTGCGTVVPLSGTRISDFFADSIPFLIADGTSLALPTPKPTTPWPSPTTTSALKLRFLPPLTTFVTRLIDTTVSLISSCDESTFSRVRFISATLKLQTCFARGFGYRLDAPVIQEAVAIEHHALHALLDQPLGDRLADRLGALDVPALGGLRQCALHRRLDGRCRGDSRPGHVVHHLDVHVRDAAEYGQAWTLLAALHPLANPVLDPVTAIFTSLDTHLRSMSRLLGAGLADLLLQHFAGVADTLLLVGIRLAHPADVRRDLPDQLPIDTGHGDVRLLVDGDVDAARDVEDHRV